MCEIDLTDFTWNQFQHIFMNFCYSSWRLQFIKITIFIDPKMAKMTVSELLDSQNLSWLKIWMAIKSWYFHAVYSHKTYLFHLLDSTALIVKGQWFWSLFYVQFASLEKFRQILPLWLMVAVLNALQLAFYYSIDQYWCLKIENK